MSKWEDKYNELITNIDNMINEQTNKVNESRRKQAGLGNNFSSAEYKQAKADLKAALAEKARLEDLKPRLEQVKNIIEYRTKVQAKVSEYKKVEEKYNNINNNNEKIKSAMDKYEKAKEMKKNLLAKIKSGTLTQEEQSKINKQITEATTEEQSSYMELLNLNQEKSNLDEEVKGLNLGKISAEELRSRIEKGENEIKKCNSVANSLIKGESWEQIEDKLANWDKKPREQKVAEVVENIHRELEEQESRTTSQEEKTDEEIVEETPVNTDKPALTFADKHPRLAKIGNFFKGIKDKFIKKGKEETKNTETKEPAKKEEEPVEEKLAEEKKVQTERDQEAKKTANEFFTKIKGIAEKGHKTVREDDLRARLTAFREAKGMGPKPGDEKVVFSQKGRDAMRAMYGPVPEVPEKPGDER